MKEEKWSLGEQDHPLFPFPFCLPYITFLCSLRLWHFFPHFNSRFHFSQSKVVPKTLALKLRLYPYRVPWEDVLCLATTFLWHNPNHTIFRSIREFLFWVSCCLFGFVKGSCLTGAHIFIQLFLLPKCAIKGQ